MMRKGTMGLAALFTGAGALHLARTEFFESIIPAPLRPYKHELAVWSGVAELACAGLLAAPRTRRLGGLVSVGLLAGVFPANVQMTLDAFADHRSAGYKVGTVARLPMQWPMIRTAWRAARGG